jgi:hypothetical protein
MGSASKESETTVLRPPSRRREEMKRNKRRKEMKAILRGKKWKEIDVEYIGRTQNVRFYKDKSDGKVYPEDVLELKEYYGG